VSHTKNKEFLKVIGRGLRQVPELGTPPPSAEIERLLKALKRAEAAAMREADGLPAAGPLAARNRVDPLQSD
jgi:hypothetical protein